MTKFALNLLTLAALLLSGCPDDNNASDSGTGGADESGGSAETGGMATSGGMFMTGGTTATDACGLPEFSLDVVAEGESLRVKLIDADHIPPLKYYNDWTVEVTDLDGNPVMDPADFEVIPFMPAHGHGVTAGYEPVVTALQTPGQFLVSPVYMWMGGLWAIYFKASDERTSEAATLKACIPN